MPSNNHPPLPKIKATIAAADINDTAVALTEHSAVFVSFQRHQPSISQTQNVNSAPRSLTSACHFGGNTAIDAVIAVTTATFTTFCDVEP